MRRQAAFLLGLGLLGLSVSLADLNDGLVAHYPFEGNADDASGNGSHGSNHTGLVEYDIGKVGQAAWFDGRSCIRLPQPRLLDGESNATISAWIFFGDGAGGQIIGAGDSRSGLDPITTRINVNAAEDARFNQVANNAQTLLGFNNGDAISGLSVGTWHLFTMVLEREATQSVFRCYVDTSLVKQATNAAFLRIAYDADMPALVGALDAAGPWQFWRGGIDDLRIYNRPLTRGEIMFLFHGGDPALAIETSQVRICWNAPTNKDSQLQYRSDLTANQWVNFGEVVTNRGERICVTDAVELPRKFYRVIFVP
jgi:hypothetical protein